MIMGSNSSYTFLCSVSLFFVILVIFTSPTHATSRRALIHHHIKHDLNFKIGLQHIDSGKNLTKFERLQRAVKRSRHRMMKLTAMTTSTSSSFRTSSKSISTPPSFSIESSVHAGRGEFIMTLSIGTPLSPLTAIIDTGSDLIWTQCEPCDECFNQTNEPIFNPTKSSTFSPIVCGSNLCNALPITECSTSSSSSDVCSYAYQYGDYSSTEGVLATETFTFNGDVSVPKIGFGCGNDNEGNGFNQADGLVGLGRGPLSLISQLDEPRFAYCLNPLSDKTSALIIGGGSGSGSGSRSPSPSLPTTNKRMMRMVTTPLGKSSSQPTFYYITLLGISVGGKRLPIKPSTFELTDDGSGGMIIDSGTTITYLEQSAFDELKREFIKQMKYSVVSDEVASKIGLEVCFDLPPIEKRMRMRKKKLAVDVPSIVFHFDGDNGDLDLPAENYMVGSKSLGVACLAMGGASGGMSIFGNVQQFNYKVEYDLGKETLSFLPAECDKLLL